MNSSNNNVAIEKACEEAFEKFQQLGKDDYTDIQSKLEYVLGSFRYDGNPVGLYQVGEQALAILKEHKKEKSRQVPKKLIESLEKALEEKE